MFGWTRIVTFAAVAAAVAMATGVAGATSKPGSVPAASSHMTNAGKISTAAAGRAALLKAANLRTRAGAARYLRAIGVNPHHFVIQRGIRNYAGANCPGKGWSCTSTAHPVVQIASAGGSNTFQCATASCAVVQATTPLIAPPPDGTNTATCIKTTGLTQSCSISQTSATKNNKAIVVEGQVAGAKMSGLTQTATYSAQITQTATGNSSVHNGNTACVLQVVNLDGSTQAKKGVPVLVTLNGQQAVTISQDSLYGNNVVQNATSNGTCDTTPGSRLTQSQTLSSSANGSQKVEQDENATATAPNITLDIKQNRTQTTPADSVGENHVLFTQSSNLYAAAGTPNGPVIQTQGTDAGGIQASVNQFARGVSTSDAVQTEIQCEHAQIGSVSSSSSCTRGTPPSYSLLTQEQHGPLRKGPCPPSCSTQAGNSGDTFTVKQGLTQNNDTGSGQTNIEQGDYTTSGTCATASECSVTQDTTVNGASAPTNTQTGSTVNTQTTCSESTCTSSGGQSGVVSVSPTGISASNTDVGEFGYGGMRTFGTGTIAVSGITAPITGAFLYWNGPTNSSDPAANAAVTFNGTSVTGTNIGFASSNCWGFANSQSYRADVTSLVLGNGSYSLSNFTHANADINGVSLIVFYNDANSLNDRNVVLWNGNDSNVASTFDSATWDETITGVPYPGSGAASLDLVVSDGQTFPDEALVVNETALFPDGSSIFQGAPPAGPNDNNGSLWDVKSFNITSFLQQGSNTLHLTSAEPTNETPGTDCLSLVVAAAKVPAAAPVIP